MEIVPSSITRCGCIFNFLNSKVDSYNSEFSVITIIHDENEFSSFHLVLEILNLVFREIVMEFVNNFAITN